MPLIRKPPAEALVVAPDADAVCAGFASGSADERWAAARAAADVADGVTLLAGALAREDNARVREAMFTALARIASHESAAAVLPFLRSDNAQVRTGALDALRTMNAAMLPFMPQLLRDADADVRLLACELVRMLPGENPGRLLCELLERESDANVSAAAIEVLADVGDANALPVLERCAVRFHGTPFLVFSIKVTSERIQTQTRQSRV